MELPGGFRIEAENPAECLILRMFTNDKRGIYIASHGGNVTEDREAMLICHTPKTACTGLAPTAAQESEGSTGASQ